MVRQWFHRPMHWILVVVLAGVLSPWAADTRPAAAAGLDELGTSLRIIPADAAFYSSMLRNREQIEAVLNSRAWAKLLEMPVVKMGLAMLDMQAADPASPVAQIKAGLEDPANKAAIDLGVDMVSNEIFVYGDKSYVGFVDLMQQIIGATRYGPMMVQLSGQADEYSPDEIQGMLLFSVLAENLDLIKTPNLVIGFKLKDPKAAATHLHMLEQLAPVLLGDIPELAGRFKKTKVGDHEYLTLTLDGAMIPWDEAPIDDLRKFEATEGDVDKVMARLKQLTLVISLGLRDDYLLVSIGSSTECLARLGKGELLIHRKEFKPLEKFAAKRITSISYMSEAIAAKLATSEKDIDDMLELVDQMLSVAELGQAMEDRVRKDTAELAKEVKETLPKPGASMMFTFMTSQGMEGYSYDWSAPSPLDGSKPLDLLKHVGGNPILALVARGKHSPENYESLVKWIKVAYGYFEDLAKPEMNDNERQQFEAVMEKVLPLLGRLDKANRELLIPAFADGQAGLVLDAKLKSEQLHVELPPMPKPMPMVEPAILFGIGDPESLVKGLAEYRQVINALLDMAAEMEPGVVGGFRIPAPSSEKTELGTLYYYPLPPELGLDEQILPNAGVSKTVVALSATKAHTARLLKATPFDVGGVLKGADERPLAMAASLDWAGLVDAVTPWVELAAAMAIQEQFGDGEGDEAKAIMTQVHTVLDILKCLKTVTSESYFEDGACVSHSLTEVQDLK